MNPLSYISPKAIVRESSIHGLGLFAAQPIAAGEIVCVKGGHIFDRTRLREVTPIVGPAEIQIAEDLFIGPLEEAERASSMIYSNHSCEPNLGVQGQIVFVALRDIDPGEELTHDWAMTDDDEYELHCNCGAQNCRRIVSGRDWQRPALQDKYRGFMSWYLQRKIENKQ